MSDRLQVTLLDYPVRLWLSTNQWFEEVRRELSLAGLSGEPEQARLGRMVDELAARHAVALGGDGDSGEASLWAAHEAGLDRVDVGYQVTRDVLETGPALSRLVDTLDRRCRDGLLLTLPPNPAEKSLMTWIAAELLGQCEGLPAHPWPGPWEVAA